MLWRAISEDLPGPKWAGLFAEYWPHYRRWWLKEGESARPTFAECRRALKTHMPEIVPLYEDLCEQAGGGDHAARFLSFYCPPPYLSGCSQAIWGGKEPVMVRNYDYNTSAFDSLLLHTAWQGRKVMGTSDGLFGLVDGVNDAGLSISLTFGGRRVVGVGFGVPLILRYVLQTCETTEHASAVLARMPTHMSYNVTVLDRKRKYLTALMAPDRPAIITNASVATNHQENVEWISHARFTATVVAAIAFSSRFGREIHQRLSQTAAVFPCVQCWFRHALHRRIPPQKATDGTAVAGYHMATATGCV